MLRPLGLIAAAGILIGIFSSAKAGGSGQQQPPGNYKFKVDVNSILLNVSVRDRYTNRGVPTLSKDDFLVFEDGIQQRVDQLIPSDAPCSALLLIDNSGSTRNSLWLMKTAAIDFTRQLKANDRIAVAVFNSIVDLIQDFTTDRPSAARAIQNITSIGGTALYDALMTCIDIYLRGITERSAIVVFTDGVDNQLEGANTEGSRTLFSQLFRRIQEIDPIIYTIFLDPEGPGDGSPREKPPSFPPGSGWPLPVPGRYPRPNPAHRSNRAIYDKARDQLSTIAEQTGGRMYSLTKAEELQRIYSEIANDLRIQYLLAYTPNSHGRDGMWHDIRVRIKNHPEAVIRGRKGYYAQNNPTNPRNQ